MHDRDASESSIQFPVSVKGVLLGDGGLCVTEIIDLEKGGPARHLHHEQDEWFYVVEGRYIIEVGEERYELGAGDSVLAYNLLGPVLGRGQEARHRVLVPGSQVRILPPQPPGTRAIGVVRVDV